jgi:hypothetical protein
LGKAVDQVASAFPPCWAAAESESQRINKKGFKMDIQPIPVIELNHEDPKQRGRDYGEAARERIERVLAAYREIFHRITGETWQQTVIRGEPFIRKAKVFAPNLLF